MEKKRPPFSFDEIQQSSGAGDPKESVYSSMNNEYKRLFLERLNREKKDNENSSEPPKELNTEREVNSIIESKETSNEKKALNSNFETNYYINKLRIYPKEEYGKNMRSFREFL